MHKVGNKTECSKHYILHVCRLDQENVQQPRTLSVKEEVFAACFTTEETKILTSDGSGTITVSETVYPFTLCCL